MNKELILSEVAQVIEKMLNKSATEREAALKMIFYKEALKRGHNEEVTWSNTRLEHEIQRFNEWSGKKVIKFKKPLTFRILFFFFLAVFNTLCLYGIYRLLS